MTVILTIMVTVHAKNNSDSSGDEENDYSSNSDGSNHEITIIFISRSTMTAA